MNVNSTGSGTNRRLATLGGGCFWCLEAVFEQLQGVVSVASGYAGGHADDPSYRDVCTGATGHAEVVQIEFDPTVISFSEVLDVFFAMHDPTTLNRQGADVGSQYRSVIFWHDDEQRQAAEQKIVALNAAQIWDRPIVTQVAPFESLFRAEEYHQGYFQSNPFQPYCQAVVSPKVAKFRQKFAAKLRK